MSTTKNRDRDKSNTPRRGTIRVGTASWSDPGFVEDWYPADLPAGARLRWYAEHFDLVEVNSSFYSVPGETMTARWVEQTPKDFVFDVKLHKLLSRHSTQVKFLPRDLQRQANPPGTKEQATPQL